MRLLFTRSDTFMSRLIRRVTGDPVSHVVISAAGHVIHSNMLGVHAEPQDEFSSEIVFVVPIKDDYEALLRLFASSRGSPYDFGALLYLGARSVLPWLPKKNLWQCSGMYLCTEWVTRFLDGHEDSEITPYRLYKRMSEQ